MDFDHPDDPVDPVAKRWRFWQESPRPFLPSLESAVRKCPRDEVIRWLDHLEKCDRERQNDLLTGAFVRRRWYVACAPDPVTWEPTLEPTQDVIDELRLYARGLLPPGIVLTKSAQEQGIALPDEEEDF